MRCTGGLYDAVASSECLHTLGVLLQRQLPVTRARAKINTGKTSCYTHFGEYRVDLWHWPHCLLGCYVYGPVFHSEPEQGRWFFFELAKAATHSFRMAGLINRMRCNSPVYLCGNSRLCGWYRRGFERTRTAPYLTRKFICINLSGGLAFSRMRKLSRYRLVIPSRRFRLIPEISFFLHSSRHSRSGVFLFCVIFVPKIAPIAIFIITFHCVLVTIGVKYSLEHA